MPSESSRATTAIWVVAALIAAFAVVRLIGSSSQHGAGAPVRIDRSPAAGPARDQAMIYVHVAGAVRQPGLLKLPKGTRVATAVERAGGPGPKADLAGVNLAAQLEDGQQVLVPARGAEPQAGPATSAPGSAAASDLVGAPKPSLGSATVEQLDQIDGIGPTLSQRIIEYRTEHNGFRSLGELREVEGIGEKRFETLSEALQPKAEVIRADLIRARPWHIAMASLAGGLAIAGAPAGSALALVGAPALTALACAALLGAALALMGAPRVGALAAALLVAGAAVGHARLHALDAPADRVVDGGYLTVHAILLGPSRPGAFGSSAQVQVRGGRLAGVRLLARMPRWAPIPDTAVVGSELVLTGSVSRLHPGGSASFDFDAFLQRLGIAGQLYVDHTRATGRRRGGLAGLLDRMREHAARAVSAGLHGREDALLRGMVLGQDEQIDEATRDDWRAAGLAHLLAVSGQNVVLLAALALPALMLAGAGRRTRLIALATLIVIYVPLAGAGPSLQRAGVMGLAGLAALAASRPASRWYALLLAAVATLARNPRAWTDPGWQLSFAAVAGILVLGIPLERLLRKAVDEFTPQRSSAPVRWGLAALGDGVALTIAATLATAPLLAHHFGSVPLAGLPANLLALPAVAPAMWLGMLKVALGQLPEPAGGVAAALGPLAHVPLSYLAGLAERCADAPGGQLHVALRSPQAVLGVYAALAVPALAGRRATQLASGRLLDLSARWHATPARRRLPLALGAAVALLSALAIWTAPPSPPDRLTIRFLDVGQGDATLIQHPDGTAVLFDGGPPEAGVTRLLRKAGVRKLALVVATHPSRDHHGGLAAVFERFPVDTLLDGGDGTTDPTFNAMLRTAAAQGTRRIEARAGLGLRLAGGDLRIRILSPPPRPPGPPPEDPNPRGVVGIVSSQGFDLMLSADAESVALLPLDLPDVDAIKVPHHGSSDPGLPEVLEELRPEIAGIEVGKDNTYGHPAPSTLAALHNAHVRVFRTDEDGTVTVTPTSSELEVTTEH